MRDVPALGPARSRLGYGRVREHVHPIRDRLTPDGEELRGLLCRPRSGSGPGILLFQEIFGINDNMRGSGREARASRATWCWCRTCSGELSRGSSARTNRAWATPSRWCSSSISPAAVGDIQSTHAHLLSMGECSGKVGAVGFCLGGRTGLRRRNDEPGRRPRSRCRRLLLRLRPSTICSATWTPWSVPACSTTAATTRSSRPRRSRRSSRPSRADPEWNSTATTLATPSAIGMHRPCTTRLRPTTAWSRTLAFFDTHLT